MNRLLKTLIVLSTLISLPAIAQQSQDFGDFTVHYNAMRSSMISPEIAKTYNIRRSDSRALINVSILKNAEDDTTNAVTAKISASGRNLTGQTRTVEMREINEGDGAIYYLGELSVRNMETFDFTVTIQPEGQDKPFSVKFRQQFYTE